MGVCVCVCACVYINQDLSLNINTVERSHSAIEPMRFDVTVAAVAAYYVVRTLILFCQPLTPSLRSIVLSPGVIKVTIYA